MRLSKLVLNGFKSFAKNTTLEFSHSISAIVGPNGSGKSNVAEAIAWALGEQSIKNLRGKKGEDLIFNGSTSLPKMSKASVSMDFLAKSGEGGDQVSISRTVYRDGINEYFLNNSQCRLKDVIEFLSRMGLGTSRHHIISQGEADRVLSATLKERREMVEDALGLRMYQIKKDEGLRKLERTEDNIRQVESLRKEIQPHLKFLKKQVERAQQVAALREKLKELCLLYFSRAGSIIKKDRENLGLRKKEAGNALEEAENKMAEMKEKLALFLKEKEKIQNTRQKVNDLQREMGRYEGMLEQAKNFRPAAVSPKGVERQGPSAERKVFVDFKKIEIFAADFSQVLEKALREVEIGGIKEILVDMREKLAEFLKEYKEPQKNISFEKAAVDNDNGRNRELLEGIEKKYKELSSALEAAKKEEERLYKENERSMETERQLYQTEGMLSELKSRLRAIESEEGGILYKEEEFGRDKAEAEALLHEEVVIRDVGEAAADKGEIERERRDIERIEIKLEESGSAGEEIIREYQEISSRDEFLAKEIEDLQKTSGSLRELIKQLDEKLTLDFKAGVQKISVEFQKFFELMFGGGTAEIMVIAAPKRKKKDEEIHELEEDLSSEASSEDEEAKEEGIDIKINLPRKRVKSLDMLSGGERALTSIAFLFAISQVNPPPFLILDETDAALDESNSRKYAKMLVDLSKDTQLILVTHNRETMKSAGILYGVTMGSEGTSRLLSVKLEEAEGYARPA